jgi:predicted nuclease of predicted toxin-antitoxin system
MRILVDESCDFGVVRMLRAVGHDVEAICEEAPSSRDADVLDRAFRDGRVLLTEDKDFGELAGLRPANSARIVLIRIPAAARNWLIREIAGLIGELESGMGFRIAVIQPGRMRISGRRG